MLPRVERAFARTCSNSSVRKREVPNRNERLMSRHQTVIWSEGKVRVSNAVLRRRDEFTSWDNAKSTGSTFVNIPNVVKIA